MKIIDRDTNIGISFKLIIYLLKARYIWVYSFMVVFFDYFGIYGKLRAGWGGGGG